MRNNTFSLDGIQNSAFCDSITVDNVSSLDSKKSDISSVANLGGFYIRMIQSSIDDIIKDNKITVKPGFNNKGPEDLGNPVVVVRRTLMRPMDLAIFGGKSDLKMPLPMPGLDGFNETESFSVTDMFSASFEISILATTLAEATKIQELIFSILFAASYSVMSEVYPNIKYVTPPVATEVAIQERNAEYYVGNISFDVQFVDSANILVKDRIIRIARLAVREEDSENIIWTAKD